jgi:hypothetical protein
VEVTAETLYEAVAQALRLFRENDWSDDVQRVPSTMTVRVKQPEMEHQVRTRERRYQFQKITKTFTYECCKLRHGSLPKHGKRRRISYQRKRKESRQNATGLPARATTFI